MSVVAFPPRDAGRVLAAALDAAIAAADATAQRLVNDPWSQTFEAVEGLRLLAYEAAKPLIEQLTTDARVLDVVCWGMASEALTQMHKRYAIR